MLYAYAAAFGAFIGAVALWAYTSGPFPWMPRPKWWWTKDDAPRCALLTCFVCMRSTLTLCPDLSRLDRPRCPHCGFHLVMDDIEWQSVRALSRHEQQLDH